MRNHYSNDTKCPGATVVRSPTRPMDDTSLRSSVEKICTVQHSNWSVQVFLAYRNSPVSNMLWALGFNLDRERLAPLIKKSSSANLYELCHILRGFQSCARIILNFSQEASSHFGVLLNSSIVWNQLNERALRVILISLQAVIFHLFSFTDY